MSDENRNSETGQFSSAEPVYGQEAIERDAGYVPLEEELAAEDAGELTAREAADELSAQHAGTSEANVRTYSALDGLTLPENVTLTPEQAARRLADERTAEANAEAEAEADKTRREVDELRGDDPDAPEVHSKPEATAERVQAGDNDDAEIERALKIPKVKAALTEVNDRFTHAVNTANEFARASFMENFPEISALPLEQWDGALAAMAQREPERFNKAISSLQRVVQLQTAQTEQQQRANQQRQAELQQYAKAESAKFEESIKSVPKAERAAIEANIAEAITEYGADINEFVQLMKTSEFASATAQHLLWEVGKYRQIMKAQKSVATRGIPPVIRPGAAGPRVSHEMASVGALEARLARTGSIKDGAALLAAKRNAR